MLLTFTDSLMLIRKKNARHMSAKLLTKMWLERRCCNPYDRAELAAAWQSMS